MSYCRIGEDSNVYVFGNGETIEVYVQTNQQIPGHDFDPSTLESFFAGYEPFPHERAGEYFDCKVTEECLGVLLMLKNEGLKVPVRAMRRLRKETREDPRE